MPRTGAATFAAYNRATVGIPAPVGLLDLDALDRNAEAMRLRSAGTTIRLATKSLRCRELTSYLLGRPGVRGVMAFTLAEALWLHAGGITDILLGYPTADREALAALGATDAEQLPVVLMVDSLEQVDFLRQYVRPTADRPLRVCLELDASLKVGRLAHLGTRRSPLHSVDDLVATAADIAAYPDVRIEGLMAYEGQIAGVTDDSGPLRGRMVRMMKALSRREIAHRRARAVRALSDLVPLSFVNGGGTGSIESTAAEAAVTEIGAGSGFLAPALFDHYRAFHPAPAVHFALDVVRRPTTGCVAVLGGGWVASGAPGPDRLPTIAHPEGLTYAPLEGPGEVQTPLLGAAADLLRVGDRVWFRHAKSGEICEHLNVLHVIRGGEVVAEWPTYRGEGRAFL